MKDIEKINIKLSLIIILIFNIWLFLLLSGCAHAQIPLESTETPLEETIVKEECHLPPELQKAYDELKELLKDTEGIDVKCI